MTTAMVGSMFQVTSSEPRANSFTLESGPSASRALSGAGSTTTSTLSAAVTATASQGLSLTDRLLLLTSQQRDTAEEILLVMKYVFFALALPTTLVTLAVFMQRDMRSATSVYVIGLSVAQILYVMSSVIGSIMQAASPDTNSDYAYIIYSIYVLSYVSLTVKQASHLVLGLVSLERLYAILRPFHIKQFLLSRFPVLFTAAAFLLVAVWDVYMLVKTYPRPVVNSRTNKTTYVFENTQLYLAAPEVVDGFGTWAPIIFTYIPLLGLLGLNLATLWALKRHNSDITRVGQTSFSEKVKQQRERQMTVTIMAATITYVVLTIPYAAHILAKNATDTYDKRLRYENLYFVMRSLTYNLTVLSCAVDFFCFLFLSSGFRRNFCRMLRFRPITTLLRLAQSGMSTTKSAAGTNVGPEDSEGYCHSQTEVSEMETK